jgi:GT2 family glycosyltransferase
MPVYDTALQLLDLAIRSVRAQLYGSWELCICDDASPNPNVRARLETWQKQDSRIKVTYSARNQGISAASNRALELASGEFVGLLDHDDELSPSALYEVANLVQRQPHADMIYSDEDKVSLEGRRVWPHFKPDWSPEYMLSLMYTCHFGVYRRQLLEEIGGFRIGFEGSQDYDLVLRISEKTNYIYHIPKILYHWRMVPGSAAASSEAKPYAREAAKRALTEHLNRRRISGEVVDRGPEHYRIRFNLEETEKISIIIQNLNRPGVLKACIKSIEEKTIYRNYEVIVLVHNRSLDPDIKQHLSSHSHKVIPVDESSNLSRLINCAATRVRGPYLLLLHGDTEVISPDWIGSMLGFCQQEEIGAVGAKLLYRNGRVEHAGAVLGLKRLVGHPLRGLPPGLWDYLYSSQDTRNCSAVSGACLMVRKTLFDRVGGFDEGFPDVYNDIDFCLRIREAGYRIVWTPDAELYHDEPFSRNSLNGRQAKSFKRRWGELLKYDPYYNPNLTLRYEDLGFRV